MNSAWPSAGLSHGSAQVYLHVVLLVLHVAEEVSDQPQRSDAPLRKAHSLNAAES